MGVVIVVRQLAAVIVVRVAVQKVGVTFGKSQGTKDGEEQRTGRDASGSGSIAIVGRDLSPRLDGAVNTTSSTLSVSGGSLTTGSGSAVRFPTIA